ncbi:hypothetical protein MPTK1_4g21110 [Marchantia polymorpha subsp. ruderalis]|uniref:Uncharacterized protein n=2 Tax=Marchantia polymorpha TaxID=3197 RepID=A0AAF6BC75_MARPO|nr:hypothetical protein MARPO_0101s0057 [Marchantia polymorpha]PTQ32270.1 hypothetical protein MARPO_0101s0057 [Marchantia polymorpha]BBN09608.1 hypothetical protein Mp_4g21110 [Marchantia polymorpha subsp. ruderalis]BBN09609.1 hypothetical protein Mp_4g21110 [Marchantia polymorpha subsp. ruderalis]|eukprot:PTQ32269.1 hypothetical protein MARPO_0101s0057 [Marchantia polymorpha]
MRLQDPLHWLQLRMDSNAEVHVEEQAEVSRTWKSLGLCYVQFWMPEVGFNFSHGVHIRQDRLWQYLEREGGAERKGWGRQTDRRKDVCRLARQQEEEYRQQQQKTSSLACNAVYFTGRTSDCAPP